VVAVVIWHWESVGGGGAGGKAIDRGEINRWTSFAEACGGGFHPPYVGLIRPGLRSAAVRKGQAGAPPLDPAGA
jgi:hypothetical protein